MSATSIRNERQRSLAEDDAMQTVCDRLLRRGWQARVESAPLFGEEEVRLHASGFGAASVELLGRWGDRQCGERWQALRVEQGVPVVWCGPPRPCARDEVIRYVEDLLCLGTEELARRYVRRG